MLPTPQGPTPTCPALMSGRAPVANAAGVSLLSESQLTLLCGSDSGGGFGAGRRPSCVGLPRVRFRSVGRRPRVGIFGEAAVDETTRRRLEAMGPPPPRP